MKIAILGFGREGKAVLKFLQKPALCKNAEIWILDRDPKLRTHPNVPNNIRVATGKDYLKNLEKFDIVFRSPGVPYNLPEIRRALKQGVEFSSATKLFFEKFPGTIIGITGTKGKGTTATLLYRILKACGKRVYLSGNIGTPPLALLRDSHINRPKRHKSAAMVILELSSFQLQDLKQSPSIAMVLDIFPDHLDSHKNMKEYLESKTNVAKFQKRRDKIFYFSDNKYSKWIAQQSRAKKIPIESSFYHSREWWNNPNKVVKIPGKHNLKNAAMAAAVALSLGSPKEKIIKVIKNFKGNEHRLELIRTIGIHSGHSGGFADSDCIIKFYNDSASTNPQTAAAAIRAFSEPKILIAGGKDKNLNYRPLNQALKNSNTKLVILFGENKKKIYKAIHQTSDIKIVPDLKSAVNLSYRTAKKLMKLETFKLITILFSPASTSFDMFRNYEERGKKFKELVRKLK